MFLDYFLHMCWLGYGARGLSVGASGSPPRSSSVCEALVDGPDCEIVCPVGDPPCFVSAVRATSRHGVRGLSSLDFSFIVVSYLHSTSG